MVRSAAAVASLIAASSMAFTSFSDRYAFVSASPNEVSSVKKEAGSGLVKTSEMGKFAPRFDGLRFIETLVTAHR